MLTFLQQIGFGYLTGKKRTLRLHIWYVFAKFFAEQIPDSIKIFISADSRYKLYINGILAEIGPCKGDRFIWYYDEVELASYLRGGENVLAVEVLRYPLTGWGNHSIIRTPLPGLYIKETTGLYGLDADEIWYCSLESNFHIVSEFPWFAQLQILENRIFDSWAVGWKEIGYDDGAWLNAKTYPKEKIKPTVSPGNLHPRPIPSMLKIPKKFHGMYGNIQSDTSVNNWNQMLQGKVLYK